MISRNNRITDISKESNSMFIKPSILPLKKEKLQQNFRKLSKEKLHKGFSKINLSKDDIKIKLKRDNNEFMHYENIKKPDSGTKIKDVSNTSIFNVTFGSMKYATPSDYTKMKVKDIKKAMLVNQINSDNEATKKNHSILKLNCREHDNPKAPTSVREEIPSITKKKYSSNNNGSYQDNSEYCSYLTAASNSIKKLREYSNESMNNRIYNTQLND
jgi:hypothetical protein